MRTRLNLYIFSRILKNNIHPGKLHCCCCCCCCFLFVVVSFLFLFFFFFHQISQSQNDETSIICLLISVTATLAVFYARDVKVV